MSQEPGNALSESDVRTLYNRMAFSYDFWGRLTDSIAHQEALRPARIFNGETVLEPGCGSGLMFAHIVAMKRDAGRNFGCDISQGALVRAAEKVGGRAGVGIQLANVRMEFSLPKAFCRGMLSGCLGRGHLFFRPNKGDEPVYLLVGELVDKNRHDVAAELDLDADIGFAGLAAGKRQLFILKEAK